MTDDTARARPEERDTGLRRVLTWTFLALAATLVMTGVAVWLVIYFFDKP